VMGIKIEKWYADMHGWACSSFSKFEPDCR
jgi:hypothetical protein